MNVNVCVYAEMVRICSVVPCALHTGPILDGETWTVGIFLRMCSQKREPKPLHACQVLIGFHEFSHLLSK